MNTPTWAFEALVMGGSAGAMGALLSILPALPATLRASVAVALHVQRDHPGLLTQVFGPRCALPVHAAQDNEPLEPGTIVFAPPDDHLRPDVGPQPSLSVKAPFHFSRPAIDLHFESAADLSGGRTIGILLSGANADGAQGLAAIDQAKGPCSVQAPDSASSPAVLSRIPQAPHVLSPVAIAETLNRLHARGVP